MSLYKQYNNLAMPNMRLNKEEVLSLLDYIKNETKRLRGRAETENSKYPLISKVSQTN
jgi:hypothetical protein